MAIPSPHRVEYNGGPPLHFLSRSAALTPACKCSFEFRFLLVVCFVLTRGANASYAAGIDSEQLQFFENRIRPVLVEHCYECHSAESTKLRGELLLDSKPGWEKGGESGPVIVPGNPDESSIISALRHESFEMPPDSKLSSAIVDDFYQWIKMGAPDPRAEQKARSESESRYDRDERRNWWSLRPVRKGAVPNVRFQAWPRGDVDRFILSGLEGKGWTPAKPASKTSWLRRVTYDLTGLPPSPEDVLEFLSDESENAFETVVDRLLESPHFGEQWARHWMDLVRYAETKAFEADYPMPNVYQYRDYLIRAFNDDVPYDRLLLEAVAGDLVSPRLHPDTGNVESVIGPGYLYLTDGQHGPPDLHDDEARIFDDMIDVLGKAFLAQTVACARCHDHKFDAITSDDYYSLYGIIASSRIDYADINAPERQAQSRLKLRKLKRGLKSELAQVVVSDLATVSDDLLAISKGKAATDQQKRWADAVARKPNATVEAISSLLNAQTDEEIAAIWSGLRSQDRRATGIGNLTRNNFGEWLTSGISFEDAPRPPGDFIVANDGDNVLSSFAGGRPAAGHLASRFAGSIRSPRFTIEGDVVSVRVKGKNVRVSLYVRHYELIGRGPTTGGTTKVINSDEWTTVRFKTDLWIGEPAYIEVQQNGGEMKFDWATSKHVDGAYGVLDAAANNQPLPPLPSPGALLGIRGNAPETLDGVVDFLAAALKNAAAAWQSDSLTVEQSDLLQALHEGGVLDFRVDRTDRLEQKVAAYRKLQSSLPTPTYVRTLTDGHGIDEPVYIRGSHKNLSDVPNPRHFLDGVDVEPFGGVGSGRKEWAETLIAGDNPLTARVAVNRIWHHLFGRGIVKRR